MAILAGRQGEVTTMKKSTIDPFWGTVAGFALIALLVLLVFFA